MNLGSPAPRRTSREPTYRSRPNRQSCCNALPRHGGADVSCVKNAVDRPMIGAPLVAGLADQPDRKTLHGRQAIAAERLSMSEIVNDAAPPTERLGSKSTTGQALVAGLFAGLTLGVVARVWMRWISTEPEFSWTGTIAIVLSFGAFATAQAGAAIVRRRSCHPRTIALTRAAAAVFSIGLFGAAGAVMFPTVLFGSIALWRRDAPRALRLVCVACAVPGVVFVSSEIAADFGWGVRTVAKIVVFVGIYIVVIAATRPTVSPQETRWKPARSTVVAFVAAPLGLIALALYFGGIE